MSFRSLENVNENIKELFIKNGYYVEIRQDSKYNNVCIVRFPEHNYNDPKLIEQNYQYYFEDNEIIATDLFTKRQGIVKVTRLNRRAIFLSDLIIKCNIRNIPINLLVGIDKESKPCLPVDMMEQDDRLIDRERQLIASILSSFNGKKEEESNNAGIRETNIIYKNLLKSGGIV